MCIIGVHWGVDQLPSKEDSVGQHVIITRRQQVADVDLVPHSDGGQAIQVLLAAAGEHLDPDGDTLDFEFEDIAFSVSAKPKVDPLWQYSEQELQSALRRKRREERERDKAERDWPSTPMEEAFDPPETE
jgi:hypothetical protein